MDDEPKKPEYPHPGFQSFADHMRKQPTKFGSQHWYKFNLTVARCKDFVDYLQASDVRLFFRPNELRRQLYFRKIQQKTTIGE